MIFNPTRGGGSEKEYTITAWDDEIFLSATRLKPGHVLQVQAPDNSSSVPKMRFTDPDTGDLVIIRGAQREVAFVMPCADVEITY